MKFTYGRYGKLHNLGFAPSSDVPVLSPTRHIGMRDDDSKQVKESPTKQNSKRKLEESPPTLTNNDDYLEKPTAPSTKSDLGQLFADLGIPSVSQHPHKEAKRQRTTFFNYISTKVKEDDFEGEANDSDDENQDELLAEVRKQGQELDRQNSVKPSVTSRARIRLGKLQFPQVKGQQTYGETRSYRAEEHRLSEDESDGSSEEELIEAEPIDVQQSAKIQSNVDLQISGMNSQYQEEVAIFIEDYENETVSYQRRILLEDLRSRLKDEEGLYMYFSKSGLQPGFLKKQLLIDCKHGDTAHPWIQLYSTILSKDPNCQAVNYFVHTLYHNPRLLSCLLAYPDGKCRDTLNMLSMLIDRCNEFSLKDFNFFPIDELIQVLSHLEANVQSIILCRECIVSYYSNHSVEQFWIHILEPLHKDRGNSQILGASLKSCVLISSSIPKEMMPDKMRNAFYDSDIFNSLMSIIDTESATYNTQNSLFALGYLVNMIEDKEFTGKLKSFEALKQEFERMQLFKHDSDNNIEQQHIQGYMCMLCGILVKTGKIKVDLKKLRNGLQEFSLVLPEKDKIRQEVMKLNKELGK